MTATSSPSTSATRTDWPTLAGRTVLVTGGAKGLGAEICRSLAGVGAHVIATDILTDELATLVRQIQAEGGSIEGARLDVRDGDAGDALIRDVRERHGRLDVLVNN